MMRRGILVFSAALAFAGLPLLTALPGCESGEGGGECAVDLHEPDDELASAVLLEEDVTLERVACPGERDVYLLPGEHNGDNVDAETVHLIWEGEEGDLAVELLDEDGERYGDLREPRPGESRVSGNSCGARVRYATVEATDTEIVYLVRYTSLNDYCGVDE